MGHPEAAPRAREEMQGDHIPERKTGRITELRLLHPEMEENPEDEKKEMSPTVVELIDACLGGYQERKRRRAFEELKTEITRLIAPIQISLLAMSYEKDLSPAEIAAQTGVHEGAVPQLIADAKKKTIDQWLTHSGLESEDKRDEVETLFYQAIFQLAKEKTKRSFSEKFIQHIWRKLSPLESEIIQLKYRDSLSHDVIAKRLGIHINMVDVLLDKVKKEIEPLVHKERPYYGEQDPFLALLPELFEAKR